MRAVIMLYNVGLYILLFINIARHVVEGHKGIGLHFLAEEVVVC